MAYDAARNVIICAPELALEKEKSRIAVSVERYDGGAIKIQIERSIRKGGGWEWAKTGRLSLEEFKAIAVKVAEFEQKGAFR